jgi:hypothetical protein
MAIDVVAPAAALKAMLTPGGTPVGTLQTVSDRTPDPPFPGPFPALFIRPLPFAGTIEWEGARGMKLDGTLSCWLLDTSAEEQNRSIGDIETDMAANIDAVIGAVQGDMTLGGAVVSVKLPIRVQGDIEGPYRAVQDTLFVFCELLIPFVGKPTCY